MYKYKASKSDFKLWLSQPIWIENVQEERRIVLLEFWGTLTRFMKDNGYLMDMRWRWTELAMWIYRISIQEYARCAFGKGVYVPEINHRTTSEDYDYFIGMIDCENITNFMDAWANMEDADPQTRVGQRIRIEIQDFLYIFVDLESSKQGKVIARFWEKSESDSDSEDGRRGDPYLHDAHQGYHGGWGSKV